MATGRSNTSLQERQLVTFRLGQAEFGADIMDVKEIIRVPDITKVPNAPDYVVGACNLRGNVLPIVDGRTRFNLEKKAIDEYSRVLVIDVDGKATGMIVDKVSEVMKANTVDIEEPPNIVKNVDADYLQGVVKLEQGNRLIMLLDVVKALKVTQEHKEQEQDLKEQGGFTQDVNALEATEEEQLVSFVLGKEEYALGIMQVNEIIRVPPIVQVPNCDSYIEGVISIRDQLLPVLNLRVYFGMEHKGIDDHTRILVVNMGEITAGLLVDKVSEVLRVPKSLIQKPPKLSRQSGEQLKGIAKLNKGQRIILILEPFKLLSQAELAQIADANNGGKGLVQHTHHQNIAVHEEEQFVTFKIDMEEYGINIGHVQEINRLTEVTKVPRVPDYIVGIVNLRGNVIPALDLRRFFQLSNRQFTDTTRIIIVEVKGKRTGIVVDSVSEVLSLEKNLIEAPPEILKNGIERGYVEGVAKLNGGKRMILTLDIEKIVSTY